MSKAKITKLKLVPTNKTSREVLSLLRDVGEHAKTEGFIGMVIIGVTARGEVTSGWAARDHNAKYALLGGVEYSKNRITKAIDEDIGG
jgi:hypothetical protein